MTIDFDQYDAFRQRFEHCMTAFKREHEVWNDKMLALGRWLFDEQEWLDSTGLTVRAYVDKPDSTDIRFFFRQPGKDHFISMKVRKKLFELRLGGMPNIPEPLKQDSNSTNWCRLNLGNSHCFEQDQLRKWAIDAMLRLMDDMGYERPRRPTVKPREDPIHHKVAETVDFDPLNDDDARERVLRSIALRRGQPRFHDDLLNAYQGRCAITDCDAPEALEAAHILSYQGNQTSHVQNGILLRADIHTLFDRDLIGVEPKSLTVHLAAALKGSNYQTLEGKVLVQPDDSAQAPSPEALRTRWERFMEMKGHDDDETDC